MSLASGMNLLWPTPLAVYRFGQATDVNPVLARVFNALRVAGEHAEDGARGTFYASDDDLIRRVDIPEWRALLNFVLDRLQFTLATANKGFWPEEYLDMKLGIAGMWFQISNRGAYHDLHNHGNCSWSGVYYVQMDPAKRRQAHAGYGRLNGCTRFYGPYLSRLGGAYVDLGNAYLQQPHVDIDPEEGMLVIFPSYLEHQALPYDGDRDRIIVSFNTHLHAASGSDRIHSYAAA